jgi:hypothetical protein
MFYREAGMMTFAVFFTGFLLLISTVLLHQIVTLNPVNPTSVITVEFFIIFGLVSGLIASSILTQGELKVLSRIGEFTISNKSMLYATAVGLPAFLAVTSLFVVLGSGFFGGELFFIFAGSFTYFLLRLILIIRWERTNKKVVMTRYGTFTTPAKLYTYPTLPNNQG